MQRSTSQQGAALLLVLWVVALLTALAATLLQIIDRSTRTALYLQQHNQQQATLDSALNRTIWLLTAPDSREHLPLDGHYHGVETPDGQTQVALTDEAGRLDLNAAPLDAIQALLREAGADVGEADRLLKAIELKRRSKDNTYLSVSQLRAINGATSNLYTLLEPDLTVFTRAPSVDERYASPRLRHALRTLHLAGSTNLPDQTGTPGDTGTLGGRVLRISIRFQASESESVEQVNVVRLTGDPLHACWILDRSTRMAN